MYNPSTLRSAFSGLVGLLQANDPRVPQIGAPLTTSSSGIYVQEKHPLVTLENIWYSAPDFNINNYPVWTSGNSYIKGVAVNDSGSLFQALNTVNNDTVAPHLDAVNWVAFDAWSTYLIQKMNQGVTNLFSEVIKVFKLQGEAKALIERQQLYRGNGSLFQSIIPNGRFVGFEILPQQAEGLMVIIDQIGTQFTNAQDLDFYLYHTASIPYIAKATIAVGGNKTFVWNNAPSSFTMTYLNQNTQGSYIIGYYEKDLIPGNQAISKEWDCNSVPCRGCDGADLMMYNRWSRYTAFRNVEVQASGLDLAGRTLPNLSLAGSESNTNWGLNFSLTVRCDITNFITYSKTLYADSYAMQMALEFMRTIAQSSRINPDTAQIKVQARAELNLSEKSTFINQYWDSVRSLKIDMSGFSRACQPSDYGGKNKVGKWRTV